jgi:hypothetical protein
MSTSPQVLTATGLITALEAGREVEIDLSGVLMDDQGNDVPCTHAWAAHDCVAFRVGVPEGSSIFVVNKSAVDLVDVAWRAEHRHTVERDENESAQPAVVVPGAIIDLARRPLVNGNFQIDATVSFADPKLLIAYVEPVTGDSIVSMDNANASGNLLDAECIDVAELAQTVNVPGTYTIQISSTIQAQGDAAAEAEVVIALQQSAPPGTWLTIMDRESTELLLALRYYEMSLVATVLLSQADIDDGLNQFRVLANASAPDCEQLIACRMVIEKQ